MEYELIKDMFPEYLEQENILKEENKISIFFKSNRKSFTCPTCNTKSNKVSTYFTRTIQDLNIIEKALFLNIKLAKFRCKNKECNIKVFSENIEELAESKARRTKRLNDMITKFAMNESAESVSRKCKDINILISGDTILRLVQKWEPTIQLDSVECIGIDDFSLKKSIDMVL